MPRKSSTIRGLRFEDMMAVERPSDPSVSPDGRYAVFTSATHDPTENKVHRTIKRLCLGTREIVELTPGPGNHRNPVYSPDGHHIAFVSDRDEEEGAQIWVMPADGGEARRLTSGYGGAEGPLWAPDSRRIAFKRRVIVSPDYTPPKNASVDPKNGPSTAQIYGLANEKSSARLIDDLLFRPWDHWRDRHRNHLFLLDSTTGRLVDLTPWDADVPPISLGSGQDYAFSPDGKEIAFVMNPDEVVARSTNLSVFLMPLRGMRPGGDAVCISTGEAADTHPRYSIDGTRVLYLAMGTPEFEADRHRLKEYDRRTGETRVYLEKFDRSPDAFEIVDDDEKECLVFVAQDRGRCSLYRLEMPDGKVFQLTHGTNNASFTLVPETDMALVIRERTTRSPEFYVVASGHGIRPSTRPGPAPTPKLPDAGASVRRLTHFSNALSGATMNEAEEFWFPGAGNTPVHGFLIKPAGFDPRRKYPLVQLIHGGPQSAFMDAFHFRWNPQVFAGIGAVVAMINLRGSTGYGQRFTEQISGDWGGRCYTDLMRGVDYLLATHRFLDPNRVAAAGASFGGYMVNWILGHTDRYKCLVCHDGVFNSENMAYTTDELWFDEHEHGGLPHTHRQAYAKSSPHLHVANFKTPTLVIHGELDYRCPISEGIGVFTALQTMGVPSRLLHFPDEGHWILKPANAQVWYDEILRWLKTHLGL